jgi:hypothetical protein
MRRFARTLQCYRWVCLWWVLALLLIVAEALRGYPVVGGPIIPSIAPPLPSTVTWPFGGTSPSLPPRPGQPTTSTEVPTWPTGTLPAAAAGEAPSGERDEPDGEPSPTAPPTTAGPPPPPTTAVRQPGPTLPPLPTLPPATLPRLPSTTLSRLPPTTRLPTTTLGGGGIVCAWPGPIRTRPTAWKRPLTLTSRDDRLLCHPQPPPPRQ